jgi:hypothetical protein
VTFSITIGAQEFRFIRTVGLSVAGLVAVVTGHQVWIGGILTFFGVMSFLSIQLPSSDQAEKTAFKKEISLE